MTCNEVLELLDELVDAELQSDVRGELRCHLEDCASCQAAYRETNQAKRLVQRRAFRHPIPGGLSAKILRSFGGAVGKRPLDRFRTVTTGLAASILALIVAWLFVMVINPPRLPLAHGIVVSEVVKRFESSANHGLCGIELRVTDPGVALHEIRRQTGIALDSIPEIPGTQLVSWTKQRFLDRHCVCLSYQDREVSPTPGQRRPAIVIFVVPEDGSQLPDGVHPCHCVKIEGSTTIFCFRQSGTTMNLATTLEAGDMENRLAQIIR